MALKQHKDDRVRFEQQVDNSRSYVLPFIAATKTLGKDIRVLEIGCGEGGVLLPFAEAGCRCVGVDLDPKRIALANNFLEKFVQEGTVEFLFKNIYDDDFLSRFKNYFDIIILKDTIEHIPDQQLFIPYLKNLIKRDGQIFFGFPPWYMPFGGHQQIASKKITMLPYYHILPRPVYKRLLKLFGENDGIITELLEIYDTRISIEKFERIIRKSGLQVVKKQHFLINPIYKYKFGLKPVKQSRIISAIPFARNFLTTCVYYTVGIS